MNEKDDEIDELLGGDDDFDGADPGDLPGGAQEAAQLPEPPPVTLGGGPAPVVNPTMTPPAGASAVPPGTGSAPGAPAPAATAGAAAAAQPQSSAHDDVVSTAEAAAQRARATADTDADSKSPGSVRIVTLPMSAPPEPREAPEPREDGDGSGQIPRGLQQSATQQRSWTPLLLFFLCLAIATIVAIMLSEKEETPSDDASSGAVVRQDAPETAAMSAKPLARSPAASDPEVYILYEDEKRVWAKSTEEWCIAVPRRPRNAPGGEDRWLGCKVGPDGKTPPKAALSHTQTGKMVTHFLLCGPRCTRH